MKIHRSTTLQYIVNAPDSAPAGTPILCFLHGCDEAAPLDIGTALERHGPLSSTAAEIARNAFITVAPQLPAAGDLWHEHVDEVVSIVSLVRRARENITSAVYLTGFSFGGNGVFDIAFQRPDIWSALWVVDPTRSPRSIPHPVWLSVGNLARRRIDDFVTTLDPVGTEPAGTRVILDEGDDHVGAARRAYADERIYRWLLQFR